MPAKVVNTWSPSDEASDFSQKIVKISRGGSNFYERRNPDGTLSLVFQTPNESLVFDINRLFPDMPKMADPIVPSPNLCNESCQESLVDFIKTLNLPQSLRCSEQNPPRPRLRDGFLERTCLWNRTYNDIVCSPMDRHTIRERVSEIFYNKPKIPVLGLSPGPETWYPIVKEWGSF